MGWNQNVALDDHLGMDCDSARTLISARIDGEASGDERASIDEHVAGCADCRAWELSAHDLRRTMVLRQEVPPAHLADSIVARLAVPQTGPGEWVRYALGVVAASLVVLNLPLLVGLADGGHQSRHLGTFGVALGIGLLWAAWQPERAAGLVPLAGALGAATLVSAAIDVGAGRTAAVTEASHLLELIGLGLLWFLSGGPNRIRYRWRHADAGIPLAPWSRTVRQA